MVNERVKMFLGRGPPHWQVARSRPRVPDRAAQEGEPRDVPSPVPDPQGEAEEGGRRSCPGARRHYSNEGELLLQFILRHFIH